MLTFVLYCKFLFLNFIVFTFCELKLYLLFSSLKLVKVIKKAFTANNYASHVKYITLVV